MPGGTTSRRARTMLALAAATLLGLALPALAWSHIERPSYWPDPEPDTSVTPAAGGAVPKARNLGSALSERPPGETRVVCQRGSLTRAKRSLRRAVRRGYSIRPSHRARLSLRKARRLIRVNERFAELCDYREIQPAVTDSDNNDRIVIMPGIYTEPTSRSKPTFDPACDQYERNNEFGEPGALSYAYHINCPNDQNLIAVMGRAPGTGQDPDPPRFDRHGIPNIGPCIRCNMQIEGSTFADDVVIDAGRVASGNGGPHGAVKDVGIRADRADGFVLRNVTVRHAKEHGIYVMESDGYLLDRFKVFYNGLYGTLTFVEDHGLQQNCEAKGHADSGIYPGAAVESGIQRPAGTRFRYNQEVRFCDSYHNLAGYSGTDGNAVHIHHNNFYGNALGIQTDVATAAGHPGFPGDSMLVENNNIYSNNFNPYDEDSDVTPAFPFPVGTGLWIAGGNHHTVRDNFIWDNWRRGTMTFAVPDAIVCGEHTRNRVQKGCDPNSTSTSHYNQQYQNVMGQSPDGRRLRNGVDFWWDDFPENTGNCWFHNAGPRPLTYSPRNPLPDCDNGNDPASSVGIGNGPNQGELFSCLAAFETRNFDRETTTCPWLFTPPRPDSDEARREAAAQHRRQQRLKFEEAFDDFCSENASSRTCRAFASVLVGR